MKQVSEDNSYIVLIIVHFNTQFISTNFITKNEEFRKTGKERIKEFVSLIDKFNKVKVNNVVMYNSQIGVMGNPDVAFKIN